MYQAKVNNTQKFEDSQGNHIVTPAKLMFIDKNPASTDVSDVVGDLFNEWVNKIGYKLPILISETEEIEVGDWYYWGEAKVIRKATGTPRDNSCVKILALPEHFSDKYLQVIVDGKIENEGEFLVKCDSEYNENLKYDVGNHFSEGEYEEYVTDYFIHLDQQNRITLFPPKKSLEELAEEFETKLNSEIPNSDSLGSQHIIRAYKAGWNAHKNNN